MARIKVGDRVTVKEPMKAYYSGYGGMPVQFFEAGMVGVVQSVDVPTVYGLKGHPKTFVVVDFVGREYPAGPNGETRNTWRVGPYERDLIVVN